MALVHSHAHGANPPGSWHEFCGQRHGPGVRLRASVRAGTGDSMGDTEKQSGTQGARWCDRAAAIMGSISLLILFAFRATTDACLRGATLVYGWMLSLLERTLKMRWSKDTKRSFVVYLLLFQSVESVVADITTSAADAASSLSAATAAAAAPPPPPRTMEWEAAVGISEGRFRKLSDATSADLFFTMSSEGSYPNKFLEVYNPTTSEIDLAGYALASCSNGCADEEYEYWNAFSSGATIAAGGHYVVCDPSSDTNIMAVCDQTNSYLSSGDDVWALVKGDESSFTTLDTIGDAWSSTDPGSSWTVCGDTTATQDATLVRAACTTSGNGGNWSVEESADSCTWVVYGQDEMWSSLRTWEACNHPSAVPTMTSVPTTSAGPTPVPTTPIQIYVSDFSALSSAITTNAHVNVVGNITFTAAITISGKSNVKISSSAGAVLSSNRSFTVEDGGMFYIDSGSSVTFTGLGFASGSAAVDGGCLYATGSSAVEVEDVEFTSCLASDDGGAMNLYSSTATISSTHFTSCSADDRGGAISLAYSDADIRSTDFTSCSAADRGGAVYLSYSTSNFIDLSLSDNSASAAADIHDSGGTFTCSTSCGVGQYGDCNELADTSDDNYECFVNCRGCADCPAGTANDAAGSASNVSCVACAVGYVSTSAGLASCTGCEAGRYATDDSDEYGIITKATNCSACPAGYHQASAKSVYCLACNAGTMSNGTAKAACTTCGAGTAASTGSATCAACARGYYQPKFGSDTCVACGAGHYQPETGSTTCEPAANGTFAPATGQASASLCPAGTYSGASASTSCLACPAGTWSAEKASKCERCLAGTYSVAGSPLCTACDEGTYAEDDEAESCTKCSAGYYQPHTGSTACTTAANGTFAPATGQASASLCPPGTYSGASASASCSDCPPGTSSGNGAAACESCVPGKSSLGRAPACTACQTGRYSSSTSASTCTACGAGTFQDTQGQTSCTTCPPGSAQPDTGQDACDLCEPGEFVNSTGAASCRMCSTDLGKGYSSAEGSAECDIATIGYYWDDKAARPKECPSGGLCDVEGGTTVATIETMPDFFRLSNTSVAFYPCETGNCLGSVPSLDDDPANTTNQKCRDGSGGYLCAVCDQGYFLADKGTCEPCDAETVTSSLWVPVVVGITTLLLLVGLGLSPGVRRRAFALGRWLQIKEGVLLGLNGKLSILVQTGQTISLLAANHANTKGAKALPPIFGGLVNAISFLFQPFNLGVALPSVGCVVPRFYTSLKIETLVFIAISALFFLAYAISKATGDKDAWVHLRRFVDFCKLFLPTITRSLFQAFSCADYDAGDDGTVRVLFADHAVNCDSDAYEPIRIYACLMIALPVGLLLGSLVGLWRLRGIFRDVDEATMDYDALDALMIASETEEPSSKRARELVEILRTNDTVRVLFEIFRPLFGDYKPSVAAWYDVADMTRRLTLTCVTVVLTDQPSFFLVSLSTSMLSIAIHNLVQPIRDEGVNDFVTVEHWLILFVPLVALLRDTNMFQAKRYWMADVVMLGTLLLLVSLLGGKSIVGFLSDMGKVGYSGVRAVVKGETSSRSLSQVAPTHDDKWVAVTVWIGAEGEEDEGKASVEIFKFDSEEDAKLFKKKMLPVSPFYDGSAASDSTDPRGGTQVCVLCVSDDDLNKIYSVKEALESFIQRLKAELEEKDALIEKQAEELNKRDAAHTAELEDRAKELEEKDALIEKQAEELNKRDAAHTAELEDRAKELKEKDALIASKIEEVAERDQAIAAHTMELEAKAQELVGLEAKLQANVAAAVETEGTGSGGTIDAGSDAEQDTDTEHASQSENTHAVDDGGAASGSAWGTRQDSAHQKAHQEAHQDLQGPA